MDDVVVLLVQFPLFVTFKLIFVLSAGSACTSKIDGGLIPASSSELYTKSVFIL